MCTRHHVDIHRRRIRRFIISTLLAAAVFGGGEVYCGDVDYNRDVRPLLSDRCFHCHGPAAGDRQASLRLDQAEGPEGAYRDNLGVRAVVPGSLEESELWTRVTSDDPGMLMPPPDSHKEPLSEAERDVVRQWIEQGARYSGFWAFVPPIMPKLPVEISGAAIDRIVRRHLQIEGLAAAPRADRRTLIRRVMLDLTGLPPSRAQLHEFLEDQQADAYERMVDRALASPHFGEHMARYWLDLVRFADTNGIHHDHYREMSPYRDWVIRAFNDGLPYDDFVRYQLAGDLYASPSRDQLIASGFHRLHLIIDRGTALPEESFSRNVIDRVTSVGTAFLGMTFQCAVCHDHKYDPITSRDFYSLSAFFNNLDAEPETGGRSGTDFLRGLQAPYIDLPSERQAQQLTELDTRIEAADKDLAQLRSEREGVSDTARPEELTARIEATEQQLKEMRQSRDQLVLTIPAAMVMRERREPRPTHILVRGAYDNPGELVARNTPAFLPPLSSNESNRTRMDLANWLVDPQHPLTARVAVNRYWQQLFGVGIVRTSEDFGAQGEWPSHPDLLDYLAVKFVQSGWNTKELFKEIVMSETYQQSSRVTPEQYKQDPQNRLLARGSRYRLDAEVVRDQLLFTCGLLNEKLYGKSVKPPQPEGLWKAVSMPSSYPREFSPDSGPDIFRRSVYTFWKRGMPPPQMTILNAPSREACIARRERTNTPLQALLLLNETEYLKAARHLAYRVLTTSQKSPGHRLEVLYETVTCHLPSPSEQDSFLSLVADLETMYSANAELAKQLTEDGTPPADCSSAEWAAWTLVTSAIHNLDITKTRQ